MMKTTNKNNLSSDLEQIKSAFYHATSDVKSKAADMLNDSLEKAKDKSHEVQDKVADLVQEKPFHALGIAALVGLALGYLISK